MGRLVVDELQNQWATGHDPAAARKEVLPHDVLQNTALSARLTTHHRDLRHVQHIVPNHRKHLLDLVHDPDQALQTVLLRHTNRGSGRLRLGIIHPSARLIHHIVLLLVDRLRWRIHTRATRVAIFLRIPIILNTIGVLRRIASLVSSVLQFATTLRRTRCGTTRSRRFRRTVLQVSPTLASLRVSIIPSRSITIRITVSVSLTTVVSPIGTPIHVPIRGIRPVGRRARIWLPSTRGCTVIVTARILVAVAIITITHEQTNDGVPRVKEYG